MIIDRTDNAITLCEIKYTESSFLVDKQYAEKLKNKIEIFKSATKVTKQIFFVLISANGLKRNKYAEELISSVVTLDDLFDKYGT